MYMQNRKVSNQRNTATKKKVQDALLNLLEQKNIDKVTVLELCSLAQVNRTTFYNHYGSQYDVLQEIAGTYLENTALRIQERMGAGVDFNTCLVEVLEYMRENRKFLQLLFSQNYFQLLSAIDIALPHFEEMIMSRQPDEWSFQRKRAMAVFIQHGIIGLLVDWIKSGCKESAEEEAGLVFSVLSDKH